MLITRLFNALCYIAAAALLALGGVVWLDPMKRELYLIDIFTLPVLTVTAGLALLFLLMRKALPCVMALIASVLMAISLIPAAVNHSPPPAMGTKPVKLIFANLWVNNKTPEALADWVIAENPDVVTYIEDSPGAEKRLMPILTQRYEYHFETWDSHVFSRFPLANAHGYIDHRNLHRVDVLAPQGRFTLVVAHFTRPWPFQPPQAQVRQRDFLNDYLIDHTGANTVIIGDFNSTPSADLLHTLMKANALSAAPTIGGTWPARLPAPLRVNIDNVFARHDISLSRKTIGPFNGSDHLPVMVDIRPARHTSATSQVR
ncbi:endonuclease/exonuclease/phosphatase family protein [Asticcacaulis sp. SL142]|uniref:endonuclease/exonuclease/phosphatase family protein n=1 Tax=Asticcacaulis sp. SL142 TaxID=2995155 RepID=UPI00226CE8C8|nr:endonuclease/exonuclease/phosphatase family protein [Asticcacaulis sp. SL142]WAC48148.1 endonuclease/exonuclease/phosphatase family protein [Asticcacaulis sp. SL142]